MKERSGGRPSGRWGWVGSIYVTGNTGGIVNIDGRETVTGRTEKDRHFSSENQRRQDQ